MAAPKFRKDLPLPFAVSVAVLCHVLNKLHLERDVDRSAPTHLLASKLISSPGARFFSFFLLFVGVYMCACVRAPARVRGRERCSSGSSGGGGDQTRRTTGKRMVTSPERRKQKLLPQVEHFLPTSSVFGADSGDGEGRKLDTGKRNAGLQVEVEAAVGIWRSSQSLVDDVSAPEMLWMELSLWV